MTTKRKILITLLFISLAIIGSLALTLGPKLWYMQSEYATATVIQKTKDYIEKTKGQWPRSWADLGGDYSKSTKFNFGLDPGNATREDVIEAITPLNGRFYTYPAKRPLEEIYDMLQEFHKAERQTSPSILQ